MTTHDMVNKLASAATHLMLANSLTACPTVVDELRKALGIVIEVGDELGKKMEVTK
jgi:hypothetical protein